ncbi:MAG: sulfur carrier protein ThiS [Pseudomonadota bacterium]
MQIKVNGESRDIAADATLAVLVEQLDLSGKRVAIEINQELVPRSTFPAHTLNEGDQVEIVQAIGGG